MRTLNFNRIDRSILFIVGLIFLLWTAPGYAQDKAPNPDKDKIRISADNLMVDSTSRYAEFSGNVRAIQGNTDIKADKLKIYYKTSTDNKGKPSGSEDSIEKIIAESNVIIRFDNKIAEAEQAVYTAEDRVLTLSGANSKVKSGNDFITGSKIILYRADGRIKVEGSGQKPVEAVLSGKNGISPE